jgi:hypothetical protein
MPAGLPKHSGAARFLQDILFLIGTRDILDWERLLPFPSTLLACFFWHALLLAAWTSLASCHALFLWSGKRGHPSPSPVHSYILCTYICAPFSPAALRLVRGLLDCSRWLSAVTDSPHLVHPRPVARKELLAESCRTSGGGGLEGNLEGGRGPFFVRGRDVC